MTFNLSTKLYELDEEKLYNFIEINRKKVFTCPSFASFKLRSDNQFGTIVVFHSGEGPTSKLSIVITIYTETNNVIHDVQYKKYYNDKKSTSDICKQIISFVNNPSRENRRLNYNSDQRPQRMVKKQTQRPLYTLKKEEKYIETCDFIEEPTEPRKILKKQTLPSISEETEPTVKKTAESLFDWSDPSLEDFK